MKKLSIFTIYCSFVTALLLPIVWAALNVNNIDVVITGVYLAKHYLIMNVMYGYLIESFFK